MFRFAPRVADVENCRGCESDCDSDGVRVDMDVGVVGAVSEGWVEEEGLRRENEVERVENEDLEDWTLFKVEEGRSVG